MNRRFIFLTILAVLALATAFVSGRWLSPPPAMHETVRISDATVPVMDLRQTLAEKEQHIAELETQLHAALLSLSEQRQLLRDNALTKTVRSADELLALFPAKYPLGNWEPAETVFEDCWFESIDGLRLHGWYLKHESPNAVILYLHGNAGNVTHRASVAAHLHKRLGVSVLLFDYRGYGRSEGVPTVDGIIRDARAARDYLAIREQISGESMVLMGRSLGGAVAVQLAADGARGVVLESTFSSLRDVAVSHYPKVLVNLLVADRLDSRSVISSYHGPLLQSHGDADRTIPLALGEELFEAANRPKTFVRIPGGDHNNPQTHDYYHALERFVSALQ